MSARAWKDGLRLRMPTGGPVGLWFAVILLASAACGQPAEQDRRIPRAKVRTYPTYVIPGPPQLSTLYSDGTQIVVQTQEVWMLMCGSDPTDVTSADLRVWAENHHRAMNAGPLTIVDSGTRGVGINIVFNADGSVPPEALSGLTLAETYLESLFTDLITVAINVSFQELGGGVIGATSPYYVMDVSYTNSQAGLVSGMDGDDLIQSWLPTDDNVHVRYNGGSDTVSYESYVEWTRASYRATVGTIAGLAANMSFNTQFAPSFDYDPANGVPGNKLSFVDVVVHEVGHVLGFISGADRFSGINFTVLDLFRFQRSDGCCNYNPETYAQFQTTPRLVSYNSPEDDVNSDLIMAEYRMEDGYPYQASHFHQQPPYIGLMQPAQYYGETHYPDYFSAADLAMFDAIGYDYPPCPTPLITTQPTGQTVCPGGSATFAVTANNALSYQWRRGTTDLTDGDNISGATTATLTINPAGPADAGSDYNVVVTNACGDTVSDYVALTVSTGPTISQPPVTHTGHLGQATTFSVTAEGIGTLTYQWRRNGANLADGGNISGATLATLTIDPVTKSDTGSYDVIVADTCGPTTSAAAMLWLAGDLNCDGLLNFADINPLVLALTSQDEYNSAYPNCSWYNADCNNDGSVSFADINAFVAVLSTP